MNSKSKATANSNKNDGKNEGKICKDTLSSALRKNLLRRKSAKIDNVSKKEDQSSS